MGYGSRKAKIQSLAPEILPEMRPISANQEIKNVSLRVPDGLYGLAHQCAQASGLSLNGLICSALSDYLVSRGYPVHSSQK